LLVCIGAKNGVYVYDDSSNGWYTGIDTGFVVTAVVSCDGLLYVFGRFPGSVEIMHMETLGRIFQLFILFLTCWAQRLLFIFHIMHSAERLSYVKCKNVTVKVKQGSCSGRLALIIAKGI